MPDKNKKYLKNRRIAVDNTYFQPPVDLKLREKLFQEQAINDFFKQREEQAINTGEIKQQGINASINPGEDDWYYQGMLGQPQPTLESMGTALAIGSLPFDIMALPAMATGIGRLGIHGARQLKNSITGIYNPMPKGIYRSTARKLVGDIHDIRYKKANNIKLASWEEEQLQMLGPYNESRYTKKSILDRRLTPGEYDINTAKRTAYSNMTADEIAEATIIHNYGKSTAGNRLMDPGSIDFNDWFATRGWKGKSSPALDEVRNMIYSNRGTLAKNRNVFTMAADDAMREFVEKTRLGSDDVLRNIEYPSVTRHKNTRIPLPGSGKKEFSRIVGRKLEESGIIGTTRENSLNPEMFDHLTKVISSKKLSHTPKELFVIIGKEQINKGLVSSSSVFKGVRPIIRKKSFSSDEAWGINRVKQTAARNVSNMGFVDESINALNISDETIEAFLKNK